MVSATNNTADWIATQKKAFTRWVNSKIETRKIAPVEDIATDLSDGVRLIQLLEVIGNESLGRFALHPKLRVQKAENVNTALDFIKHRGVQLYNIGAEDIIDGNLKLILGMLWTLILRFTIEEISQEGLSAKEGLLLWCQRKTALYNEVDVRDFSASWNDGLAFCALLDHHRPDLIDYDSLDKEDSRGNLAFAFKIAADEIGIPQLLDPEDLCVSKPDERSILTYVAHWFHAFSAMDKMETAGRRVERFLETVNSTYGMQTSFERRMSALFEAIDDKIREWEGVKYSNDYRDVKKLSNDFSNFKAGAKRDWVREKSDLSTLLGNIKTKLATYQLKPYTPPLELTFDVLEGKWRLLLKAEAKNARELSKNIREIKEDLRKNFADTANEFALVLSTVQTTIGGLDGELEEQLEKISVIEDQFKPLDDLLERLKELHEACEEANIEENDYTVYSYEELVYEQSLAREAIFKKLSFIENQVVARNTTQLTPIQLEEFESVFRYFDKYNQNSLGQVEFAAALASLGLVYSDQEMEQIFQDVSQDEETVSFEQYIRFMVDVTEDHNSPDQVLDSFMEVAEGKPYVTELDLKQALVPEEVVKAVSERFPKTQDGAWDYVTYLNEIL